jgi:hypothetical protein
MCHDELHSGDLVLALPGWAPPPAIVHAVFPSRRGLVPAVRQFLDFLGEHLRRQHGYARRAGDGLDATPLMGYALAALRQLNAAQRQPQRLLEHGRIEGRAAEHLAQHRLEVFASGLVG